MDAISTKSNMLKLGLVSDELTRSSLIDESMSHFIAPRFSSLSLKINTPDILFVESTWQGYKNTWKFKIANYPDHPKRNNKQLISLVNAAKKKGIPTIFWNKEDGIHFDRFIDSAKHFDHIFTVDENCISRYREIVPASTTVHALPFPVQPRFHHFQPWEGKKTRANFVGSYSHHIHDERRARQDFLLKAANDVLGLDIYDRNSDRNPDHYRFPSWDNTQIKPSVSYPETANIYHNSLVSLNVNTVTDSPTMYSRRLVEIIACGGVAVTTPALSVDKLFSDYCYVVDSYEESVELFSRLKHGPSKDDLERAKAGAEYVAEHHTWEHRLNEIRKIIGI